MSCKTDLSRAEVIGIAKRYAKKAIEDETNLAAIVEDAIDAALPTRVRPAVEGVVADVLPTAIEDELNQSLPSRVRPTVEQVVDEMLDDVLEPAIDAAIAAALNTPAQRRQQLCALIERPTNKTYTLLFNAPFAGTIQDLQTSITGDGSVTCTPAINQPFAVGDNVSVNVSGATTTSRDCKVRIEFQKAV